MSYIGKAPTPVPLTSEDIADGTIATADLANDAVTAIKLDETETFTVAGLNITTQGDLQFQDTTGGEYVAFQAPGTISASYTLTLPDADGTSGQAIVTDGSGALSFSDAGIGFGKAIAAAFIFG